MGFGGGAFGTGSYAYSIIDNQTIQLSQQKGVIYANATISEIQNIVSQNGAISGTIAYSEPATSKYYKKFIATLSNFQNQNPTNFLSNSGTTGIGEAPQLSSTYAQYDDGASVFNNYWNFAGTSLPSGLSYVNSGSTITINNGATVTQPTSVSGYAWLYTTSALPAGEVIEVNQQTSNSKVNTRLGWSTSTSLGGQNTPYNSYDNNMGGGLLVGVGITASSAFGITVTPTVTEYPNGIYSFAWLATGSQWYAYNYASGTSSDTTSSITSTLYGYYGVGNTAYESSGNNDTQLIYWLRTRAYPPNSVMPSVSFGSFTSSSGASITIPSGIDYYMPITITNNQSVATPSPFQQMIQININNYSNYMYFDGNIANFEFFTSSGTIIPAWIESNNNGTLTIWVKLSSGIGANSSITIYLGVANIYQFSITYPVAFTTEANIIYNSGITASTTLTALTITLNSLQQMNGTIIVEGY